MLYYRHHKHKGSLHYVCVDVLSDRPFYRMPYYIFHIKMDAQPYVYHKNICIHHSVHEVVHLEYPGKKKLNIRIWFIETTISFKAMYTYLLTYSTVQSPWEANWSAASQEIPRISQNPKVHYRTHKRPPPVSILGQPNPVHIHTTYFLEINPNIIYPSMPRSPQWFFPSSFPIKILYAPSPHPYAPHSQPIAFFSILSPTQYWVRSTSHLAPRYAISSIPPLPRPS